VLITKTRLDVREVHFSFVMNDFDQIWILDTRELKVWDTMQRAVIPLAAGGYSFTAPKGLNRFDEADKCEGIYCEYGRDLQGEIIDDKEELNNLYMMENDPRSRQNVEYKSILLDLVERYKTYERVKKNCPKITHQQLNHELSDGLLFKFRKYYMIADIQQFNLFKHLNFPNLYEVKKVCPFCKAQYDKIDSFRVNVKNSKNVYLQDKTKIQIEIERVLADSNNAVSKKGRRERKIFSKTFYSNSLANAYKPVNQRLNPVIPVELLGRYEKKMIKRQKVKEMNKRDKDIEDCAELGGLPSINANKNDQLSLRFH
jgi:hypothetical protein